MDTRRFYLTSQGVALQAKAQTGVTLTFSKVALGDGEIISLENARAMTTLVHERNNFPVLVAKLNEDKETASIIAAVGNDNVYSGYYVNEIGLFAIDPDVGEILYAVANCKEEAGYLPAKTTNQVQITMEITVVIGNAENLAIHYTDHLVFALKSELDDLAGVGRTIETVKKNADDIKDIQAQLFYIESTSNSQIHTNRFKVNMAALTEEEDFGGVWNEAERRLEI